MALTYPDNPVAEVKRTTWIIRRFMPSWCDAENLALDVLLESWANGIPHPAKKFIHQRCIDKLREKKRENLYQTDLRVTQAYPTSEDPESKREVEGLVKCLTPLERKLIFYRFYLGCGVRETAMQTGVPINKVRDSLRMAIYKMREVGDRQ